MNIRPLKWDSDFFKIKIARIDVDSSDNESDVKRIISNVESEFDLIYIFGGEDLELEQNDNCRLVDEKVVYAGSLKDELIDFSGIKEYVDDSPCSQLYNLSFICGKYSRYKKDTKFRNGDFERLYGKWIENSVNKTFADKVLCYYDEKNVIKGMVTVEFSDNVCSIGLIAVDNDCQSKGIGKKLMAAVRNEMCLNKLKYIEVATQMDNIIASSFYESCGLKVKNITRVYHYWLRKNA